MPHFKAFGMINLQYVLSKNFINILNKAANDKNSTTGIAIIFTILTLSIEFCGGFSSVPQQQTPLEGMLQVFFINCDM